LRSLCRKAWKFESSRPHQISYFDWAGRRWKASGLPLSSGRTAVTKRDVPMGVSMPRYFSTVVPDAASELFDGELIIAHYGSGYYYSVSEAGALVWQGLRSGLSLEETLAWLSGHFPDAAGLAEAVEGFAGAMSAEGLLTPTEVPEKGEAVPETLPAAFGAPEFERFEDLQELLMLDPVHDVAEAGWPRRADDDAS
jgi:hypothetical protein